MFNKFLCFLLDSSTNTKEQFSFWLVQASLWMPSKTSKQKVLTVPYMT
jgi:hypothetical protein